jgi:pentatricopeptide repeat protein
MVRVRKWSNDVRDDRSSHHSNVGGGTDFAYLNFHMGSRRDYKNGEMEMAVSAWLRMQESDFYCNGIFKVVPRCNKCSLQILLKNIDASVELMN